jgi:hypothetical protein
MAEPRERSLPVQSTILRPMRQMMPSSSTGPMSAVFSPRMQSFPKAFSAHPEQDR